MESAVHNIGTQTIVHALGDQQNFESAATTQKERSQKLKLDLANIARARKNMVSSGASQRCGVVTLLWLQLLLLLLGDGGIKVASAGLVRGGGGGGAATAQDGTDLSRSLQAVGSVTQFDLINAITEKNITTLSNGQVIVVSSIPGMTSPNFNVEAKTSGTVGSVVFALNGVTGLTENGAPWAFCGNIGSDFTYCPSLNGTVTVSATPYSAVNGGGTKGTTVSVTFSIVLSAPASPTTTTKSPTKSPVAAPTSPLAAPTSPVAAPVAPSSTISPVLIDCGSSISYTDSQNRLWLADVYYDAQSGVFNTTSAIANTVNGKLYQTERTGVTVAYNIPRPPGTYAVTLHFAEI
jgi:Malectin domain